VDVTVNPLEKRVDDLAAHVERLQGRVEELSAGMVRMVSEVTPAEVELASQFERLHNGAYDLAGGLLCVGR
jgi:outer membrane murein-binding lipoprotein Lpp